MTNHTINESQTPQSKMEENDVKIGDTIEVLTDNQEGYKKFKVISGNNNKKTLETIEDWEMGIYSGGKVRKRKNRKSRKKSKKNRKNRKSRRR